MNRNVVKEINGLNVKRGEKKFVVVDMKLLKILINI